MRISLRGMSEVRKRGAMAEEWVAHGTRASAAKKIRYAAYIQEVYISFHLMRHIVPIFLEF